MHFILLSHLLLTDKHGQLGIWDALAPKAEVIDEDGESTTRDNQEGGKIYRLQPHWPASSKSTISCCKLDPLDSHSVRLKYLSPRLLGSELFLG